MTIAPGHFRGRADAYAEWAAEHFTASPLWCAKHWAPCPVDGRNGVAATLLLTRAQLEHLPADVTTPSAINSWLANRTTPLCCELGDTKMAALWLAAGAPGAAE